MLSQLVKVRRVAFGAALFSAALCARPAFADVLEQVPANAAAVLKIKSLDSLNTKMAKMAKDFGLDELQPDMKDPLGALLKKGHIEKGLNKSGDAALVIFIPDKDGDEPVAVALVPVSDYDAFVGNYEKADGGTNEIAAVKDPEGGGTMYIAHRGKYAAMNDKKEHLSDPVGLKLNGIAAREAAQKDAVFVVNMPVIRAKALPEFKKHREQWRADMEKELTANPQFKPYMPVFKTMFNEAIDGAQNFLEQTDAIVLSLNIGDEGFTGETLVEFAPDSTFGKTVAKIKPTDTPLLAGLPDKHYFIFGGASADPKALAPVLNEILDPIEKDLKASDTQLGQRLAGALESLKTLSGSVSHSAAGWIVPTKPLGQESLFQQIQVAYGDAPAMAKAEKKMLTDLNDLMAAVPNQGAKSKVEFGESKNVDGVDLQSYSTKVEVDENDPRGQQAQQLLSMLYGPGGAGGNFGAVNDKTFIATSGLSDEVLKEAIDAAKAGKDTLGDNAGVKNVMAHMPGDHVAVYFVALDNVVTTAVRYAQGFGVPIKMKVPHNLPPIGMAVSTEGSAFRVETYVPTQTVQSLIAAGIQAYTQMQQNQGGGL